MRDEISICIPTVGRNNLYLLLSSLKDSFEGSGLDYEVVIASTKKSIKTENGERIFYNKEGSASEARNICAFNARGNYLVFIDDDCTVGEDYAKRLIETIQDKRFMGFSGLTQRLRNKTPIDDAWLDAGFDRYFRLPERFKYLRWGTTSNLVVMKDTFLNTGGFAKLGTSVGGEDVEFGMRFNEMGFGPIKSVKDLVVYHQAIDDKNVDNILRKAYLYGQSEQILSGIYPEYRNGNNKSIFSSPLTKSIGEEFQKGRISITQEPYSMSLSMMAEVMNNMDGRLSVMMIKPYGMEHETEIVRKIEEEGFIILDDIRKNLSLDEICQMYSSVFERIKSDKGVPDSYIQNHINYLSSSEVRIMLAYNRSNEGYLKVMKLRGESMIGNECSEGSIRYLYPGKGVFNSFHATINKREADEQIKSIFNAH